jgi:hypothetical protein
VLTPTLINGDVCSNLRLRSTLFVTGHISLLWASVRVIPLGSPYHVTPSRVRVTAAVSQIATLSHIQILVLQICATLTLLTQCHSVEFANLQGWALTDGPEEARQRVILGVQVQRGEGSWGRNGPIAAPGTVALVRRPCLANVGRERRHEAHGGRSPGAVTPRTSLTNFDHCCSPGVVTP